MATKLIYLTKSLWNMTIILSWAKLFYFFNQFKVRPFWRNEPVIFSVILFSYFFDRTPNQTTTLHLFVTNIFLYIFLRKLFQSTRLYIKGIVIGSASKCACQIMISMRKLAWQCSKGSCVNNMIKGSYFWWGITSFG